MCRATLLFFSSAIKFQDLPFGGKTLNCMVKLLLAYIQYFLLTLLHGLQTWSRYTPYSRFCTLSLQTLWRQMEHKRRFVNYFSSSTKTVGRNNLIMCSYVSFKSKFTIQQFLTCIHKLSRSKLNLIACSHSDKSSDERRLQKKYLVWKKSIYLPWNSKEEWVYMVFYCLAPNLKQSSKQLPGSCQQTKVLQKILFNLP